METILQRAREKYPDASPRIITDNGSQFIANDFKHFIVHAAQRIDNVSEGVSGNQKLYYRCLLGG